MRPVIPGARNVPRAKPINIAEPNVAVEAVEVATVREVVLEVAITQEVNVAVAVAREAYVVVAIVLGVASVSEVSVLAVICLRCIPVAIRVAHKVDAAMDSVDLADLVAKASANTDSANTAVLDTGRAVSPSALVVHTWVLPDLPPRPTVTRTTRFVALAIS
jgi:hypothetical protein